MPTQRRRRESWRWWHTPTSWAHLIGCAIFGKRWNTFSPVSAWYSGPASRSSTGISVRPLRTHGSDRQRKYNHDVLLSGNILNVWTIRPKRRLMRVGNKGRRATLAGVVAIAIAIFSLSIVRL